MCCGHGGWGNVSQTEDREVPRRKRSSKRRCQSDWGRWRRLDSAGGGGGGGFVPPLPQQIALHDEVPDGEDEKQAMQ